jgi:hypothetical protein
MALRMLTGTSLNLKGWKCGKLQPDRDLFCFVLIRRKRQTVCGECFKGQTDDLFG